MAVIGMDLGGTKLSAAIFDISGKMAEKMVEPLAGRQGDKVGELIAQQASELLQRAKREKIEVTAVGVSVPGIYYTNKGTVWAPNIPGWDDYPLLAKMRALLPQETLEIKIDSDRACYILGETWQGSARGCRNAIFLAIGTGIGAGILIDGQVLRGHNDIAGAVGWLALQRPFKPDYASCGCFEYHASGEGIAQVARQYLAQDKAYQGSLRRYEPSAIKSADVFAAFDEGDKLARRVIEEAIACWGMAAADLISIFNPEKIIFGGGVFGPAAQFLEQIYREAIKWAQPISFQKVELTVSSLGGDAGLIGAARLAREYL
ncbi:ROK family protein [candidate division KSB1 bacterium]|nr:ROK family protein [candidate division KSB1 bacterium]